MAINLVSAGKAFGSNLVFNEDLKNFPEAYWQVIKDKTGVESRYHCKDDEFASDLAIRAAKDCLDKAKMDALSLDAIVLSTSTPDRLIPATAAKVQFAIGAKNAFAFDTNSVCSGGIFAMEVARALLASTKAKNILVIAVDVYSKFLNPEEFSTYPYFGDGAGAVLLSKEKGIAQVLEAKLVTDGSGYDLITIPAGGSEIPHGKITDPTLAYFAMDGRDVFEFATQQVPPIIEAYLKENSISKSDISLAITHQANKNIVDKIAESLSIERAKFFTNLERCGNTSSASVFIALAEKLEQSGAMPKGSYAILASFGGGLSVGVAALLF